MPTTKHLASLWVVAVVMAVGTARSALSAEPGEPEKIAMSVLSRLDTAWTAADGASFARNFSEDAQVINIFGQRIQGQADLIARMQLIFDTIFMGSVHRERNLEYTRRLSSNQILVVSTARVDVPQGPQAPQIHNRQTFLLELRQGSWQITHWQNTPIVSQRSAK